MIHIYLIAQALVHVECSLNYILYCVATQNHTQLEGNPLCTNGSHLVGLKGFMTFVNPTQPMAMQTLYQLCYMPPLGLATLIMTLGEIMGTTP